MKLHYKITLEDGTVAESTFDQDPIDLEQEEGLFPDAITKMLIHLDMNMEYEHYLLPEDGWGVRDPDNVYKLPIDDFSAYDDLSEGMILNFDLPNGDGVPGAILDIADGEVKVDFNHPFAGQNLTFNFKRVG